MANKHVDERAHNSGQLTVDGLYAIAMTLEEMKEEAVKYKLQIEERWVYDELQYEGFAGTDVRTKRDYWETFRGRQVPPQVNITQPMTDRITARMCDMLVPTNDRNWKMEVDPATDYSQEQDPLAAKKADEKSCNRQQDIIDGQLKQSRYSEQARNSIADGCRLGCGVLKGPFNTGRTNETWVRVGQTDEFSKQSNPVVEPAIAHINPWNFFPLRAKKVEDSPGIFELHQFSKPKLREAVMKYGFDRDAVAKLTSQPASHGPVGRSLRRRSGILGMLDIDMGGYVIWEFNGILDGDNLAKVSDHFKLGVDPEDSMAQMAVEAWFCQGILLKLSRSKQEGEWKPPYSVWSLYKIAEDIFGYGAPYSIRDQQRVVSSTWEMGHYDCKLSAGPQIVRDPALVEPEDDDVRINGPKSWVRSADAVVDANAKPFEVFEISSSLESIMIMHDRAREYAEYVLNLPQISQSLPSGGREGMNQTASGLAMQMNAGHVVLRLLAQQWDDHVTIPRIGGFYDWNMAYHPDNEAKGVFRPIGRGASHLLVKDIQAQHTQAATLISQDERFAPLINNENLLRRNFEVLDIPVDELILSPEEIEELKNQPSTPVDEVGMARVKLEGEKFKAEQEDKIRDDDYRAKERVMTHAERLEDSRIREATAIAGVEKERIRQETEMIKTASKEGISYKQLEDNMGIANRIRQSNEFIAGMKERSHAAELEHSRVTGKGI